MLRSALVRDASLECGIKNVEGSFSEGCKYWAFEFEKVEMEKIFGECFQNRNASIYEIYKEKQCNESKKIVVKQKWD